MKRIKSGLLGSLMIAIMLCFLTGTAYSQDSTMHNRMHKKSTYQNSKYDKAVTNAASKLRTQVNLTMDQTRKVEGILQDYKENKTDKSQTMDNIQNVLTSDQKDKFNNVKDQWWSTTEKSLKKTSNSQKTSDQKSKSGY